MKTYLMIVGMLVVLFVASDVVSAVEITGVTIEAYSSHYAPTNLHPDNLLNGSGLDVNGPGTHSVIAQNTMWQTSSGSPLSQWVVFDLGAVYEPNAIKVWNYNESLGDPDFYTSRSGTKDVLIKASASDFTGDWDSMPVVGSYTIEQAPGYDDVAFGTVCDVNDPVPAVRYILLEVVSTWDDPGDGVYPYTGLSEVRFLGTQAAFDPPEVNAGEDASCCLTAGSCFVDLDGTVINPPGAPAETTLWTAISGPGAVVFGDASQVDTTATFTVAGSYVLQLEADNTYVGTDTVSIEVYPDCTSPMEITGITIEDFSSYYAGTNLHPDNLLNGNGLDVNGPDTHSTTAANNMWQSDSGGPSAQYLVFDLGAVYDLASMKVWNFNEGGNAAPSFNNQPYTQASGTKDVLLRGSATLPAGNDWDLMTSLGTYQIEMAPGDETTAFGTVLNVSGGTAVRYLLLDVQSSWDDGSGYPWVGLSEVRFTEVPEPITLVLLGLGLPLLRKKRKLA